MTEQKQCFVLDSYALLAYFQAEPAGMQVLSLLESAREQNILLFMSWINVGELYYTIARRFGVQRADELLQDIRLLPICLDMITEDQIIGAAKIKAAHTVSYADAFTVVLAQERNASIVTGDPEFRSVESEISVHWLVRK